MNGDKVGTEGRKVKDRKTETRDKCYPRKWQKR